MVLGTLVGCTTKDTSINEDDEIVLAAARDLSPGAKDAYYATSILFVWEPLIGLGDKGNPCAELAEKWTNSEDFKEWTFKIKEGVKFHDGVQLDADAVIKNFDRYMNMKTKGSPFYSFDLEKTY
ncbi:MAG TPA: ABC transporter substrate-binding protein, partial [Clostridium sp.]|nr:ABC transporter substrate-binding protein [Clostridium sp.]